MAKLGRKPRNRPVSELNARILTEIHGDLRNLSTRTGLPMRLHLESALRNYLPRAHEKYDKQALSLLK